eukprot:gnl/TRDRNA2_/TRDRNA2_138931_c0_seq2.p1 gnl/TRDRNA2_/TRDRNA2_138931_c0~~gnl/TRDRNA2_/TRDRNA2_138931_c0_seq2.p1  ORF type:complete len:183 (+),score=20.22 gnl/TRDRNA2_/TRDRNA2_138931_c0_seq2:78-626(+)
MSQAKDPASTATQSATKNAVIALWSHRFFKFSTLHSAAGMIVNHYEQAAGAYARGDNTDFFRASGDFLFDAGTILFLICGCSMSAGCLLVAHLGGWGMYIHLVLFPGSWMENFMTTIGMWETIFKAFAYMLSDAGNPRSLRKIIVTGLMMAPLGVGVLQIAFYMSQNIILIPVAEKLSASEL